MILILISTTTANAQVTSRNSADIGFTSNANLTTENKESDLFLRVATSNRFPRSGKQATSFRLSYMDYFEQNENDYLAASLQNQWGDKKNRIFTLALAAQHFPNGGSGVTETAFNNYGLNFSLAKGWQRNSFDGDFGAGYKMRYYPDFEGRNDHNGYGFASGTYEISSRLVLNGYAESGLTVSSLSEYTRLYGEITGTVEYLLPDRWTWANELTLGRSHFLDRSVTTQTRVVRKRVTTQTSTANERYTNFSLASELMRSQAENFKWGAGATVANQSSLSDLQDYSVITLEAKLILHF